AAARTKVLLVDEVRKMLDDRFRLLVDGSKTAPPRLQTLLAAIKWSFDLLTPEEQQLLERLSVFAGGWTLAAATAVGGSGEDEFAMLDRLTRLADKSLIALDYGCGIESRYTMLETVRQYALAQITADGVRDARVRHARFFAGLAADYETLSHDANKVTGWLTRMNADHENVLAAHAACGLYAELAETGLELARSIDAAAQWWGRAGAQALRRAANPEAAAQLTRAPERLAKEPPSRERDERELELLIDLGAALIHTRGWNSPEVKDVYTRALAIARVLDKPDALLASFVGRWAALAAGGRLREALSVADETERLAQASSNGAAMLQAHHLAFPTLLYLGEIARCRRHIADMLDLYDEVAHREHRIIYLNHDPAVCGHSVGAMAAWCAGDIDEAWQSVARADSLARRLGHVPSLAHALYF